MAGWRVCVIASWFGRPLPSTAVDLASSTFVEREDERGTMGPDDFFEWVGIAFIGLRDMPAHLARTSREAGFVRTPKSQGPDPLAACPGERTGP